MYFGHMLYAFARLPVKFYLKGLYLWIFRGILSYVNIVNVKEWVFPLFRLCMKGKVSA